MKLFLAFMIGLIFLWVLLFIFAMSRPAKAQTLTCTIPRFGQHRWIDLSYGADSVMVDCSGGDTVAVDSLRLYRYQGGLFQRFRAYFVRGMEGQTWTSDSLPPGQYEARAWNQYGESCGGNIAHIGPFTGVPTGEVKAPERLSGLGRLYDVRGRLVRGKPAAGIYFNDKKKKVVILR